MNTYATIQIDDTTLGNCGNAVTIPSKTRKLDLSKVEQAIADMMVMRAMMFVNTSPTIKGLPVFK